MVGLAGLETVTNTVCIYFLKTIGYFLFRLLRPQLCHLLNSWRVDRTLTSSNLHRVLQVNHKYHSLKDKSNSILSIITKGIIHLTTNLESKIIWVFPLVLLLPSSKVNLRFLYFRESHPSLPKRSYLKVNPCFFPENYEASKAKTLEGPKVNYFLGFRTC